MAQPTHTHYVVVVVVLEDATQTTRSIPQARTQQQHTFFLRMSGARLAELDEHELTVNAHHDVFKGYIYPSTLK